MKKYKMALDIDNTLNKMNFYFLQELEYNYGVTLKERETHKDNPYYRHYNLRNYTFLNEIEMQRLYEDIWGNYKFWINIPLIYEKAVNEVESLNNNFDLYLVTYPYKFYKGAVEGKRDWIRKNFPFIRFDQIIYQDKINISLKNYDVVIEDTPEILKQVYKDKIFTIKYKHQYNDDCSFDFLLSNWINDPYSIIAEKIMADIKIWRRNK